MASRTRPSTFLLLRALWRYRSRIEGHGTQYQAELATAVRTALDARATGRTALTGYRLAMRVLLLGAIALVILALLLAIGLWQVEPALALLALLPLVPAGFLAWWRMAWGAPLDWLQEHADPERTVPLRELPGRLRTLSAETRQMADVPSRLADELDALAGATEPTIDASTSGDDPS